MHRSTISHRRSRRIVAAVSLASAALLNGACDTVPEKPSHDAEARTAPAPASAPPAAIEASPAARGDAATAPRGDEPLPAPPAASPRLAPGIALYDRGDYNGAIRALSAREFVVDGNVPTQIAARKLLAFSYCVSGRPAPCKQQFDAILKLDRGFELTPAEAGHPLWGPVFKRAKADAERAGK